MKIIFTIIFLLTFWIKISDYNYLDLEKVGQIFIEQTNGRGEEILFYRIWADDRCLGIFDKKENAIEWFETNIKPYFKIKEL